MTTLAITLAAVLFAMAAVQAYELWACAKFIRSAPKKLESDYTPKVAVLMTLRGADPDLHDGLVRLLTQDYPDYELRIIVDAQNDPAWKVVEQAMKTAGNDRVKLAPLTQRGLSRSLYCSALVQAAAGVDESFEAVVLMDGDVVPHKTWLRELLAPLENKNVGAAFGNRWYFPTEGRIGSLVRYVWNQGAVAFMRRCKMPWAGSLAIRRRDLVESGLFDRWSNGLVADAPTPAAMATMGREVVFVPTVLIANREECDLATCREFLKRQHLWGCLYHRQWPAIAVYTWASSAILAAAALFLVFSTLNGDWLHAAWLAGGLASYAGLLIVGMLSMEFAARERIAAQGEPTKWLSPKVIANMLVALPFAQFLQLVALQQAFMAKQVSWRGVVYAIDGPFNVRRLNDMPYTELQPTDAKMSL